MAGVVQILILLGILIGELSMAAQPINACDGKSIKVHKTTINSSTFIFIIKAIDRPCIETQNTYLHNTYLQFRSMVTSKINVEPIYLLKLQREIFNNHLPEEVPLFDSIINGELGAIRNINILESLLFTEHLKLNGHKNEFGAIILRSLNDDLKIYFTSNTEATVSMTPILSPAEKDLANGFSMEQFIHNHPFNLENIGIADKDVSGTTIPSRPDLKVFSDYKIKYGLKAGLITNGFSTIEIQNSQF